jgi:hypothetical protein
MDLYQHDQFSVHSLCLALINSGIDLLYEAPMKIKIVMWNMYKEVVLIKQSKTWMQLLLAKRLINSTSFFIAAIMRDFIQHLFFYCCYARFLWRLAHITFNIPSMCITCFVTWRCRNDIVWQILNQIFYACTLHSNITNSVFLSQLERND